VKQISGEFHYDLGSPALRRRKCLIKFDASYKDFPKIDHRLPVLLVFGNVPAIGSGIPICFQCCEERLESGRDLDRSTVTEEIAANQSEIDSRW
jgi:hypothetical protein